MVQFFGGQNRRTKRTPLSTCMNVNNLGGIHGHLPEFYAFPSLPNEYSNEDAQRAERERENEHILSLPPLRLQLKEDFFLFGILGVGCFLSFLVRVRLGN